MTIESVAVSASSPTYTPHDDVTWDDGTDVVLGSSSGTKLGTAATQKLGLFGVTPVVQRAAIAALTNSLEATTADGTLEAITGVGTVSINAVARNLSELNAKIDAIRQVLIDLGLMAA